MEGTIGEIRLFGGNFAPRSWAFCNGQLLSISTNTALFAILGTTYGGNGQTTFALPDLRGRVPIHPGTGPGLSNRVQGEMGGSETTTLNTTQLPAHSHTLNTSSGAANTSNAGGATIANGVDPSTGVQIPGYLSGTPATAANAGTAIGLTGNSQPVPIMQPFNTINYIICLQGIFPSRN